MTHDMTPGGKRPDDRGRPHSQQQPPDMTPPSDGDDETTDPRHVTGQLFIRETGAVTLDGRRLVILAGVVALDQRALEGEHQYVVLGRVDAETDIVRLSILPHSAAQDLTDVARGKGIDDLLTEPIWST